MLGLLPSFFWLWFYLRKDSHPEPKRLIAQVFVMGMASAGIAFSVERLFFLGFKNLSGLSGYVFSAMIFFFGVAFIEEYLKYFMVKIKIVGTKDFDEPVDAMVYMITVALGFAALENMFYIFDKEPQDAITIVSARFLSASVLHITSSGIVGYFLSQAYFFGRKMMVGLGILVASIFHMAYNMIVMPEDFDVLPAGTNYFIIKGEDKLFYLLILLIFLILVISFDFKKLTNNQRFK